MNAEVKIAPELNATGRPRSAVSAMEGLVGLIGLLVWTVVARSYGSEQVSERHRHRYEVNNTYRQQIADAGLVFSGISPDRSLVEYIELPVEVHPFYVATQAHPELRSRPTHAHPLFRGLVEAALERQAASTLFAEPDAAE